MTEIEKQQMNINTFNQTAEEYLQEHQVFNIFSQLCQKLAVQKPKNALEFLISELENDIRKKFYFPTI
jgi:UDP-galactopyranose mutase